MRFSSENELNQWVRKADRLWLLVDYDGTLKEFTRTPDILKPDPKLIDLIQRLVQKSNIRLAIITGRRLKDIQTLLPIEGIFFAATYGVEVQTPQGDQIQRVDFASVRPFFDHLKPQWQEIMYGHKGFYLEDKGWALAVHARFASKKETNGVFSAIKQTLNDELTTNDYQLSEDKKFLEISPAKANKAKTVSFLLSRFPFPGASLLYMGDDVNDAEAFKIIQTSGGVALAVAQYFGRVRASGGDFVLKSPKIARMWLENLVEW
ncbi:MAG: trehalose-phosphatase [Anaerolineales bacterium]